jgi:hypothetical protein
MSCSVMNNTPLLCIGRALEQPLPLSFRGLLVTVSVISAVSTIGRVDFLIVMFLLRGPLATRLKESSLGLRRLYTYVSDCE